MNNKPRLLIVEDDSTVTNPRKTYLKNEGYEVDTAEYAMEAIEMFKSNLYDFVITDIWLRDKNGVENNDKAGGLKIIKAIVELDKKFVGKIIVITGRYERGDKMWKDLEKLGVKHIETKPITSKMIHEIIQNMRKP